MIKFCKKCQVETERFRKGECKLCAKARSALYRLENAERTKAKNALYRSNNAEKVQQARDKWSAANPVRSALASRNWRLSNPEKMQECRNAWVAANPEKSKTLSADWKKKNPDAVTRYNHSRRARKISVGGTLSKGLFAKLFTLQRGKCPACKEALSSVKPRSPMDHIIALINGGANEDYNIQILCQPCNQQKHAKHPVDFMQSRGFLI